MVQLHYYNNNVGSSRPWIHHKTAYTAPLLEQCFKKEKHFRNTITLNSTGMVGLVVFIHALVGWLMNECTIDGLT